VFSLRAGSHGISAQYSGEPVYHVDDHPRWLLRPDVGVKSGEDILLAGTKELRRLVGT
jgi:hypothetical protein